MKLTKEQEVVVNHPAGNHARILAVAGSGKTSTLVYRIKHLVVDEQASPASIQVLMFNSAARKEFKKYMLEKANIPQALQPKVDTFHSFAYGFVQDIIVSGRLPGNWDFWTEDKEEKARLTLNRIIETLEKAHVIPANSVDSEEAYQAIQLWKGSLIPPPRAGYRGNNSMPRVYDAFERERMNLHAITYDDFVPIAVSFLEKNRDLLNRYNSSLQHLIVDEYQDVNYGQQRLVELLAGTKADVMVVGDDDQTIYEWRGARPNYIIREFQSVFDNKPHIQYTLSNSFRFGPVIAQCAYNTILFNTNRVPKSLVSNSIDKAANIFLFEQSSNQSTDTSKLLADQVLTLVKSNKVRPSKIIVLCRMFAQLSNLESEFMTRKIPYCIIGQRPFFERREVRVLLGYVRLAISYHQPITEKLKTEFLNVANTPNRMLARRDLEQLMNGALSQKRTLTQALEEFSDSSASPLNNRQRERVLELMSALERAHKRLSANPKESTDILLSELIISIDYFTHFENYYGKGEASFEHKESILNFIEYAKGTGLPAQEFLDHVAKLDTTRGVPNDQQIVMTTIFRTKGLEYDYVIIPNCNEGYIPCLYATGNQVFDTSGQVREPDPSEAIENERRLFYVALTRAKEAVYIGTGSTREGSQSNKPSRFIDESQVEPTVKVMTALQQVAAGRQDAKTTLLSHLTQFGGIKSLIQNLLSYYLVALGDQSLIGKIALIVSSSREIPFRYRFPYSASATNSHPKDEHRLDSAWDDIDE